MPAYVFPDESSDYLVTRTGIQTITGAKTFDNATLTLKTSNLIQTGAGYYINTTYAGGTMNATIGMVTPAANVGGIVVRGFASQTANLVEYQNSANTVLGAVTSGGIILTNIGFQGSGTAYLNMQSNRDPMVYLAPSSATSRALVLRGTTSQTAHLTQWQDPAGNNISWADSVGNFRFNRATVRGDFSTVFNINNAGEPGTPAFKIIGAVSQTADLQQWQNSAGTTLAAISPTGAFLSDTMRIRDHYLGNNEATASTAYTNLTTIGPTVLFTMPPSGLVSLNYSVVVSTGGDQYTMASPQITRESDGVVVAAALDEFACQFRNGNYVRVATQRMFAGTPGIQYRVTMLYRTLGGLNANWERRILSVTPSP